MRERVSVALVFVAHGLLFASWTAHIPAVKGHLHLSDSSLGLALLGAPIGSVALSAASGWLLPRFGSRTLVRLALLGYCVVGPGVGLAGNLPELFAALLGWGAFQGMLDVSMNTQAIAIEQRQGARIMSGLHGGWGTGAFLGAGTGSLGVAIGLSLAWQLVILGGLALVVAGPPTRAMLHDPAPATEPGLPLSQRFSPLVLVLGATAFASMLCEGASADWAAVYLHDHLGVGSGVAGLAYTTFALAMVAVRLAGIRMPTHRVLPALGAVGTVGFATALAIDDAPAAYVGYACLGLGLGAVVPTVFSAAGRLPGMHPGSAVAAVAGIGWTGFMTGPPIIGWLAGLTSLRTALVLVPVLTAAIVVSAVLTPAIREDA